MSKTLGLYVHIPFCRSKCDYCDFYSLAGREDRMDDYQKALIAQISEGAPLARGYTVNSIYIGGGTPSWYGEKRLCELLRLLQKKFKMAKDIEVTVEANPDSVTEKALRAVRRAGVNRLSLGMQSACDQELQDVHRPHTFQQVVEAVHAARKAKIKNLNLDLIYGLPGQTMDSWKATVEHALSLIPQHLSCYGLKVEEGTPLARRVAEGEVLPDDDQQAEIRNKMLGFIFQQYNLIPKLTVLENVELPLLYAGVNKKERRERAIEALQMMGLGQRLNFRPNQLSGGQCQRVAIARAIVGRPKLLLADEPTGALDSAAGNQIMDIFDALNDAGSTIIMITHEQEIAERAKRINYIRDGILSDGRRDGESLA